MHDHEKSKEELIRELRHARERIAQLQAGTVESERIDAKLRENEERLRTLFDVTPHGIVEVDTRGNITASNPAHARILGYAPGELIGMNVADTVAPEYRDHVLADLEANVTEQPEPTLYETEVLRKDGSAVYCEIAWDYHRDSRGGLIGFACVMTDVTERKQASELLRVSEEKYRGLVNNLSEAVLEFDAGGRILFSSPQIFNITGLKPEEITGQSGFQFVHPDDVDDMKEALREAITSGHTYRNEYRIRHKEGHYVPVGGSGRVIHEAGEVRVIGTVGDITERKRVEQAFRQLHHELTERVQERTAELETANTALRERIAETEKAKAELVESETRLTRLLENLPDFVTVVDRQATILYANRPAPGVSIESLLGPRWGGRPRP